MSCPRGGGRFRTEMRHPKEYTIERLGPPVL